jgi:type I restriction enzyme, S subunit
MILTAPFISLLSHIVDNRGRTCPTAETGLPLIATNCVKNLTLYPVFEKVRYVDQKTYENWFRGHPLPGDLIFVCKGSPGQVCVAPDPVNFCIAQDMMAIRADPAKVYPPYLFAALRSDEVQNAIANMHVGSLIPHFKKGDFDKLYIPLPDETTQHFTGDLYLTVTEKIELNRQMNQTLEWMAQAIFRDWFVDFGPVRRKLAGETDAVAIMGGLTPNPTRAAELAALFPDTFGEDDLPVGWKARTLGDIAKAVGETVDPKSLRPDTPYFGLEHLPRCSITLDDWGQAASVNSNKAKFKAGQVLFGKLRPYFHKVGIAPLDGVCSTDIVVMDGIRPIDRPFVVSCASSKNFVDYTDQGSTGTKMPRTSWGQMKKYPLAISTALVRDAYSEIVQPMHDKIIAAVHENRTLADTRDYLLPRLMSGTVRVAPRAEAA